MFSYTALPKTRSRTEAIFGHSLTGLWSQMLQMERQLMSILKNRLEKKTNELKYPMLTANTNDCK